MRPALSLITLVCLLSLFPSASGAKRISRSTESIPRGLEDRGIAALDQVLKELTNPYSVMCVAATPDDVDWGTLAYYHRKLGARAILVLATRTSSKPGDLRWDADEDEAAAATRRTLDAARIVGADVYFLDLQVSGDSKSAEELLKQWGHDEALGRFVRAFRLLRPDVVVAARNAAQQRQEAVWQLVIESFEAAADEQRFPGADSRAWQVRRIFQAVGEGSAEVEVNLAEYDRARGVTYAQIAAEARQSRPPASHNQESSASFYKLARSVTGERLKPRSSLLTDLALPQNIARSIAPPSVGGMTLVEAINQRDQLVEALSEKLLEKRVEGPVSELYQRYGAEFSRVLRFTELLERAIALALGLDFGISISDDLVIPGQKVTGRLVLSNGSDVTLPVVLRAPVSSGGSNNNTQPPAASDAIAVQPAHTASRDFGFDLPQNTPLTFPHSAHLSERDYYPLGSGLPGAQSTNPFGNEIIGYAEVGVGQTFVILAAMVRYDVASPVELSLIPNFALIRDWEKSREATFIATVRNRTQGPLAGALWVVPLAISSENYEPAHIEFVREDEEVEVRLKLKLPILKPPLVSDVLLEFRRENPATPTPLTSVKIALIKGDFEVATGTTVGVLTGSNSEILVALSQLDVAAREVSSDELRAKEHGDAVRGSSACSELSLFDSIIIDSSAYSLHRDLSTANRCLLDYVRKGGNLVVLGQAADDWDGQPGLASFPAPFSLKVLSPGSAQTIKALVADHPLLTQPNRMDERDFVNWLSRGSPTEWARDYTSLLGPAGSNSASERSWLLAARLGEGTYVYASFDLRDQLRARNIKAYRFLANLVSAKRPRQPWYDDWH